MGFVSSPEPRICAICVDDIHDKEWIQAQPEEKREVEVSVELRCHHIFHEACVQEWFKRILTCPECRGEVKEGDVPERLLPPKDQRRYEVRQEEDFDIQDIVGIEDESEDDVRIEAIAPYEESRLINRMIQPPRQTNVDFWHNTMNEVRREAQEQRRRVKEVGNRVNSEAQGIFAKLAAQSSTALSNYAGLDFLRNARVLRKGDPLLKLAQEIFHQPTPHASTVFGRIERGSNFEQRPLSERVSVIRSRDPRMSVRRSDPLSSTANAARRERVLPMNTSVNNSNDERVLQTNTPVDNNNDDDDIYD